ncbi:22952_t:CDS:2 [Gigaspora margarita]|uniref:22952_t:CDS:1 n=1 Tax=Gigaspora margarita TaxID=4874 RepID=A0ABN7US19_GIGMA|nr:22952_t:CDS:2 [Gigaspora margarita]
MKKSRKLKKMKKHKKVRVEDDNNGRVITEIEGMNCTDYSGKSQQS